ncbi:MAG: hypothetical protein ACI9T8_000139 [Candidatus Saccharimonadales bacterium]|jgi:hypothetical protein
MMRLSDAFMNRSVLSLRTGSPVGLAIGPIIDPNNLKIAGWHAKDLRQKGDFILPTGEVREIITKGLVVNDHDALTHPEDLVRLKPIIDIAFELVGKQVVNERKRKIGKVTDYSVDNGFYVKKIYATPSLIRSLKSQQLVIDRDDILEVTDSKIVVREATVKSPSTVAQQVPA